MASAELISKFRYASLLNQDQAGRRIILKGTIEDQPALLLAERAAFSSDEKHLKSFTSLVTRIENLGDNDIYKWYMANTMPGESTPSDLKINLIYPCKQSHIKSTLR